MRGIMSATRLWGTGHVGAVVRVVVLRCLTLGVTVLTGLLTAAVLGPAGRGEQAALVVAPQFLAGLATLGLHASLIYNMRRDPDHEREYVGANLLMTCLAGCIMAGIGYVLEPYWLRSYGPHTIALSRLFLIATPFISMSWSLIAANEVRGAFGFANGIMSLQNIGILGALLIPIHFGWLTPGISAGIYMISALPVFFCLGFRVYRQIGPVLTLRHPYPAHLLRYGIKFYGVDLLGTLSNYLDQIIIVPLLPPATVGIYVVAQSVARALGVVAGSVASVLFPSIAAKPVEAIIDIVAKALRITNFVSVGGGLVLGAMAPLLIQIVYGSKFEAATLPMRILIVAAIAVNSARILYQAYSGSGRPGAVTVFEGIGTAVSFVGMLALVPLFGLAGAACAILLASVARFACALIGLRLFLDVRIPRMVIAWSDVASVFNR